MTVTRLNKMQVGDLVKFDGPRYWRGAIENVTELAVITKVIQSMKNGFVAHPNDFAYEVAMAREPYELINAFECEIHEI